MKSLSLLVVMVMAFTCVGCAGFGLASDEELINRFNKHKAEFNELVTNFSKEKDLSFMALPDKNPEKWQEYSVLLQNLKLENITGDGSANGVISEVTMIANTRGLYDEGEAKGYVYTRKKLETERRIRNSLNSVPFDESASYYRPICENWYLFVDVTR